MFDDFLTRSILAGVAIAIIAGPLGCLIVWRRMSFFGDSLAHSALLGVALGVAIDLSPQIAVPMVTFAVCFILVAIKRRSHLPSDAVLGIIAHSTLALGLVTISLLGSYELSVMRVLLGDILSVTKQDLAIIYGGGGLILIGLFFYWRAFLAATISPDIATAEGLSPQQSEWIFMVMIALVVAIALKLIGALLITAMLVIPAAAARRLSPTPEIMAGIAILIALLAMGGGIFGSLQFDTPTGPSIVLAAAAMFGIVHLLPLEHKRK